jgi:hypothetical protein
MTTTIDPKNETARCKVLYDEGSVELISPTGTKVRVDAIDYEGGWDGFSEDELRLLNRLTTNRENGQEIEVSWEDMKAFKALVDRAGQEKPKEDDTLTQFVDACAVESTNHSLPAVEAPPASNGKPKKPLTKQEKTNKAIESVAHSGYIIIWYDIPDELNALNPSREWWRYGFRINGSVWCMKIGQLTYIQDTLDEFDANDVWWSYVEVGESSKEKIHILALRAYEVETVEAGQALIKSINTADEQYKTALAALEGTAEDTEKNRDKKASYRLSRIKQTLKMAGERLNSAIESAIEFDEFDNTKHLFDGLRETILARNKVFEAEWEKRQITKPPRAKKGQG